MESAFMPTFIAMIFILSILLIMMIVSYASKRKRKIEQTKIINKAIQDHNLDISKSKKVYILHTHHYFHLWFINDTFYLLCDISKYENYGSRTKPFDLITIMKKDIKYYFKDGQLLSEVTGTGDTVRSLFVDNYYRASINTRILDKRSCRLFFTKDGEDQIIEFANDDFYTFKDLIPEKDYEIFISNQKEKMRTMPTKSDLPFTTNTNNELKAKLTQLKELYEAELITAEEYRSKKENLLHSSIN